MTASIQTMFTPGRPVIVCLLGVASLPVGGLPRRMPVVVLDHAATSKLLHPNLLDGISEPISYGLQFVFAVSLCNGAN